MKQKCIIIAYPMGRTGSSAIMGLLDLHGIGTGPRAEFFGKAAMNPKGFFELKDQDKLLSQIFNGFYPNKTQPPSVDTFLDLAEHGKHQYLSYLREKYGNKSTFALKSPRCLSLGCFHHLKDYYDYKVVMLNRDRKEQIASLLKINNSFSELFLEDYLNQWDMFSKKAVSTLDFVTLDINFKEVIEAPIQTLDKIFKFCELEIKPNNEIITDWIDKKLVNRKINLLE